MTKTIERRTERGMALVVALLMMLIVTMIGTGLTVSSRSGTQVGTSFTAQQVAFQAAEAGLEHAREWLRSQRYNAGITQSNFTPYLMAARGADTALVLPNDLTSFGSTNGFVQAGFDDVPVRRPTGLFGASYQVFLNNDPAEGLTNPNDANNRIMLTALGSGPNGVGFAAVQAVYETIFSDVQVPGVPGVVTLLGPNVTFSGPSSNTVRLNGNTGATDANGLPICYPSIATTSNASRDAIHAEMGTNQSTYRTCNPLLLPGAPELTGAPTVINFIDNNLDPSVNPYQPSLQRGAELPLAGQTTTTPQELTVGYWNEVIAQLSDPLVASYVGPDTGNIDLGTQNEPKVVVITGDFALQYSDCSNNGGCGGILLVRGNLTVNGTPSYQGTVYAVGTGNVTRTGGGNGVFCGGLLVANINEPYADDSRFVGVPTYTHNGGGTSSQGVCTFAREGGDTIWGLGLRPVSFQQLRDRT